MEKLEQNQNQQVSLEKEAKKNEQKDSISPEQQKAERITQIDQRLTDFSGKLKSQDEIDEIQQKREREFQEKVQELESGLGQPLTEESKTKIHQNMIDSLIERAQAENEQYDRLVIEKTVLQNVDNSDFKKRMAPLNNENITEETFKKALDNLLNAEIYLPRSERVRLFRQTVEYYTSPSQAEKPLLHSTSSYSLRKSLEEGLSGGHGKFAGEAGATSEEGAETQRGLSVSHPEHPSTESFQQLFARLSSRKSELQNYLKIDSEKITGKTLPEVFVKELFGTLTKEEMKEMLAKRMGVSAESIDDETLQKATSEEVQKSFIDDFNKREYTPNIEKIRTEVLPTITDEELRGQLEQEAEHPFPTLITLESSGEEEHLTTVSRGEKPTHIPFEDFYWDTFHGEDIREIRVPENQISKVRGWLQQKGLNNVKLVPLEIFEVKRLIQDSI